MKKKKIRVLFTIIFQQNSIIAIYKGLGELLDFKNFYINFDNILSKTIAIMKAWVFELILKK